MKKDIHIGPEFILSAAAILLLLIVGLFYYWGIGSIISGFGQAFTTTPAQSTTTQFQSDAAQKILRTRGIIQ